jgi:hypothetical protein
MVAMQSIIWSWYGGHHGHGSSIEARLTGNQRSPAGDSDEIFILQADIILGELAKNGA